MGGILASIVRYCTQFTMFFKLFSKLLPKRSNSERLYLDYASSTPVDMDMFEKMPRLAENVVAGNPSALHREGVLARETLDSAREAIAQSIYAHKDEIIFTSNATESDNLALVGTIEYFLSKKISPKEIIVYVSSFEHQAVIEPLIRYGKMGIKLLELSVVDGVVDEKSIVVPKKCKAMIVTSMFVNNEFGTVQPIKSIAKRIRFLKKENENLQIIFHVDATQAPLFYSLRVDQLGVDLMSLGSTKLYCTKGVGMLYKKRNVEILPILYGGGHEFGLRPGTEPVALIHQFSYAFVYAQKNVAEEFERVSKLQKYFESLLKLKIPEVKITFQNTERSPHISHIAIPNLDSELLVIELDARGISVSSKSACKNEDSNLSPIVEALYGNSYGAIRFSFGRLTNKSDLDRTVVALQEIIKKYKNTKISF